MAAKREKQPQFITPAGAFVWPKLVDPDYGNDAFPCPEGKYTVKLALTEAEAEPLLNLMEPYHKEAVEKGKVEDAKRKPASRKKSPFSVNDLYEPEYNDDEELTGRLLFNFKMTASGISKKTGKPWKRRPAIFDAKGQPMTKHADDLQIWGGTIGKVGFTFFPYFVAGTGAAGVSLRLEAVQIIDLVSGGERSAAAYGFGEEEGYQHVPETAPSSPFGGEDGTDADDSSDDDGEGDF